MNVLTGESKNLETIYKAAGVMGVPFEMLVGYIEEPDLSEFPIEPHEEKDVVIRFSTVMWTKMVGDSDKSGW